MSFAVSRIAAAVETAAFTKADTGCCRKTFEFFAC